MKSKLIVLFVLLISFLLIAGVYKDNHLDDASGNETFVVQSDTTIYSEEFQSWPYMTLHYVAWDTASGAGNDSIDLDITVQSRGVYVFGSQGWYTEKTFTITGDSTQGRNVITSSAVSNERTWRIGVTGGSNNCVKHGVNFKVDVRGYRDE